MTSFDFQNNTTFGLASLLAVLMIAFCVGLAPMGQAHAEEVGSVRFTQERPMGDQEALDLRRLLSDPQLSEIERSRLDMMLDDIDEEMA